MAKARRRSGKSSRDSVRAKILEQWWGAGERLDPEKNISAAGDWLEEIMAKLRLEDGIEESKLRGAWKEVAGEFVAGQTEPVSLHKGVLTLKVLQPSMKFHLEQSRGEILSRLQQSLGRKKIREIRLTIG